MAGLLRQHGGDRLQVDQGLAAESAADLHGDYLDVGNRYAQDVGRLVPNVEMSLAAAPDSNAVVGGPQRRGGMGFDVALMHRLGTELPLYNDVGFREALLDIAGLEEEVVGDVGALAGVVLRPKAAGSHVGVGRVGKPLMEDRRVVLHGFQYVNHGGQNLVVHVNQLQSLFRDMCGSRGHGCNRVSLVQGFIGRHTVVAEKLWVDHSPFAQVYDPSRRLVKVGRGHHRLYSGQRQSPTGVDALDPGVGVGASEHLGVKQPRQVDVRAVPGPSSNLFFTIMSDGPTAHYVKFLSG